MKTYQGALTLSFAPSVVATLAWAYFLHLPHNLTGAALTLITTALLANPMIYILFTISIPMAIAVVPYQILVALAAASNWNV